MIRHGELVVHERNYVPVCNHHANFTQVHGNATVNHLVHANKQLSKSIGLVCGSLVAAWYLGDVRQSEKLAIISALHHACWTFGTATTIPSLSLWTLKPGDGNAVNQSAHAPAGKGSSCMAVAAIRHTA